MAKKKPQRDSTSNTDKEYGLREGFEKDVPVDTSGKRVDIVEEDMAKGLGSTLARYITRGVGVFIILASASVYAQLLPLVLVLLGGYIGVSPDVGLTDTNTLIWLLSAIFVLIPFLLVFIHWIKYVWTTFIKYPKSLFRRRAKDGSNVKLAKKNTKK